MTFAAAMKIKPDRIIAMIDSKITDESNGHLEYGKKDMLYGNGVVLFLGDANIIYETRRELRTPIKGRKIGFSDYIENMKSVYNSIFLSKAQENVLTKFNLDWARFEQGKFPNQITSEIANQLKEFDEKYDTELIFITCDDDKEAQIISAERPYGLSYHEPFYIDGSTDSAKKIFSKLTVPSKTYIDIDLPEAVLTMAEAMKDVSDTAYIGGRFTVFDVGNSGADEINPDIIDKVQEESSSKKSREDKIKSIEEILKDYKK